VLGTGWRVYNFGELSISLVGVANNKNVDIFVYDNQGTVQLDKAVWSSDSARGTALALQDGIWTMNGFPDRRYVGTVRTSSSATAEDSLLRRFVWNQRNRVPRKLAVTDSTASWTYTLLAYRQANGNTANKVEVVTGLQESLLSLKAFSLVTSSGTTSAGTGIGEDSTTVNIADFQVPVKATTNYDKTFAELLRTPTFGYHAYNWLEHAIASGTVTWYTTTAGDAWPIGSGLLGTIDA
jgi:hypothetical protein